jgi:lysine N6-hydroxylase
MDSTIASQPLDLVGVGVGPFNLGLASLLQPVDSIKSRFFEAKEHFEWHGGLLMEDCTLQVPFLADLVSMVDPCNRLSYLNYLHQHGRMYQFYFHENFHIPRVDYNRYCRWASEQLPDIQFSRHVLGVTRRGSLFEVETKDTISGAVEKCLARNIVVGVGTTPSWPAAARDYQRDPNCIHSASYLLNKKRLQEKKSITVIGSGQSAAEVLLDLLREQPQHGYELNWLSRSNGFLPMEYSKLGLEHFSPDYTEHFHRLPEAKRNTILAGQSNWYKGISFSTIAEIYDELYRRSVVERARATLQCRSDLRSMAPTNEGYRLSFQHLELDTAFDVLSEAVVLSTGYQYSFPRCLTPLRDQIRKDLLGRPIVQRDYSLEMEGENSGRIFMQNGEMHTHGISAPDLGLGAHRSATIINAVLGREQYCVSNHNVFQTFGISDKWRTSSAKNP